MNYGVSSEAFTLRAPSSWPAAASIDPILPSRLELLALCGLVLTLVTAGAVANELILAVLTWVAPLWLIAALGFGTVRMVLINTSVMWTTLFWFRVATCVYFGFGSLVPYLVNATSLAEMGRFYAPSPDEIFKLDVIVAISSLIVLAVAAAISNVAQSWERRVIDSVHEGSALSYGLLFGTIGYSLKLFVVLPQMIGALAAERMPGALLQMADFSLVGLYMIAVHAFRGHSRWIIIAVILLAFDVGLGALQFSKFVMILPLILFALAWIGANRSIWRAAVVTMALALFYLQSQPFIEYGRQRAVEEFDTLDAGTLSARLEIAGEYFNSDPIYSVEEQSQSALVRLSYVNAGCFAIAQFDGGRPGPSLNYALATFIPRFAWPNKPIITDIGSLFNMMATGSANSGSSPGYFADAYWAWGWNGVFFWMTVIGALFTFLSRHALRVSEQRHHLHFPLVLLAMKMGFRVDGALVPDVIGAAVIWFWGFVAVSLVSPWIKLILRPTKTNPGP